MKPLIDLLMCVGSRDIEKLFLESLSFCCKNLENLSHLYIVTPCRPLVEEKIRLLPFSKTITVLEDQEVLPPSLHSEDGWYKQQLIKLHAKKICQNRFVACLSSDTILLSKLPSDRLFSKTGLPFLRYRKHRGATPHYLYEQLRLKAIEKILKVPLKRAHHLVDFILDLTLWDTSILSLLDEYLQQLYGPNVYQILSPGKCNSLGKRCSFGEWSLYAAFLLDVLQESVEIKSFDERYFFQVHSLKDLKRFDYTSQIVHFVAKDFDLTPIKAQLQRIWTSS